MPVVTADAGEDAAVAVTETSAVHFQARQAMVPLSPCANEISAMTRKDRTTLDYLRPGTEERVRARENFRLTDADGNQQITFAEFAAFMADLDPGMTAEEYRIGFDEIDTDRDGIISFEEFRVWLQS